MKGNTTSKELKESALASLLFGTLTTLTVRILAVFDGARGVDFGFHGEVYMLYLIVAQFIPMFIAYYLLRILHGALGYFNVVKNLSIELFAFYIAVGLWVILFLAYPQSLTASFPPGAIAFIVMSCGIFSAGSLPMGRWLR